MKRRGPPTIVATMILLVWIAATGMAADQIGQAVDILDVSGVQGGLVVHIGCGDGKLTAALHAGDGYLVHGLDTDAEQLATAREHIRSLGLYGKVSVDQFNGRRLPYVDNLVTLLVAEDLGEVSVDEVMRVLAPLGVAYVGGEMIVKPWPTEIDEWTHFLHGPDNNAVAEDKLVGPPRSLQWLGGPAWARHHDGLAHVSGSVSSRGRIFYIIDEGPTTLMHVPAQWRLVARDAFNGVLLWKRTIPRWESHLRYFRTGPTHLPRRLIAVGDRVYATLGYGEPVSVLNAATGKTIRTLRGTENTEELVCHAGILLAVTNSGEGAADRDSARDRERRLIAVDADTGKARWTKVGDVSSLTLAANGDQVFFQSQGQVVCADLMTGTNPRAAVGPLALKGLKNVVAGFVFGKRAVSVRVGLGILGQHACQFVGDVRTWHECKSKCNEADRTKVHA